MTVINAPILIDAAEVNWAELKWNRKTKWAELFCPPFLASSGELAPHYGHPLIGAFLRGTRDPDPSVRASCLSNMGELCQLLRFSLGSLAQEVRLRPPVRPCPGRYQAVDQIGKWQCPSAFGSISFCYWLITAVPASNYLGFMDHLGLGFKNRVSTRTENVMFQSTGIIWLWPHQLLLSMPVCCWGHEQWVVLKVKLNGSP